MANKGKKNNSKYHNRRARDEYAYKGKDESRRGSDYYGGNHISWYVPDNTLLNEVASIPFNYRTGDRLNIFNTLNAEEAGYIMPGLMQIKFLPTYGEMSNQASPINVAATGVYSFVRHVNSGSRNYDACDLMLYLMAMDSIYMGIADITRQLAMLTTFSKFNRYVPNAPLFALGLDASNGNLWGMSAQIRARLDRIILKASTLCVPATFPLYVRHNFMCSNVYFDRDNQLGQMYVFVPEYLYKFQLNEADGTGELIPVSWNSSFAYEWEYYLDTLEGMVDAIYGDEDAGIMSGDILKAYGDGNLFKLQLTDPNAASALIYDADMLEQIHNCMIAGKVDSESLTIKQNLVEGGSGLAAYLVSKPRFYIEMLDDPFDPSNPNYASNQVFRRWFNNTSFLFDLHHDPSPERVMRSTRLMWGGCATPEWNEQDGLLYWEPISMPSEIVTEVRVYKGRWNPNTEVIPPYDIFALPSYLECGTTDVYGLRWSVAEVNAASTFSGAPIIIVPYITSYGIEPTVSGNLDRVTTISLNNMVQLNEVAMLGLYNVPRLTLQATSNS